MPRSAAAFPNESQSAAPVRIASGGRMTILIRDYEHGWREPSILGYE